MPKKLIKTSSFSKKEQAVARYVQELKDIEAANLSRRDLLKLGLVAGAGGLTTLGGSRLLPDMAYGAELDGPPLVSPPCQQPWTDPLPIPKAAEPCSLTDAFGNIIFRGPEPHVERCPEFHTLKHPGKLDPNTGDELDEDFFEARVEDHQRIAEFGGVNAAIKYELAAKEIDWNFYSEAEYPTFNSKVWAYTDMNSDAVSVLRINAFYGQPIMMRMYNMLPKDGRTNHGFGINQICPHLHNAHNPPESDGGPLRFFDSGSWYDFWYPNVRAGFASTHPITKRNGLKCKGNWKETQSTLWFHDHRFDFTSQNVYKGLASFYTLFSKDMNLDTGDESTGFRLPSGEYDIPMLFADKLFDQTGQLVFDVSNTDGFLGDMQTVNLKIKPYLNVKRRKYRFRFLDGGPSRYIDLSLSNGTQMLRIANDGNLMRKAKLVNSVRLGVAERADVIIDFSQYAPGTEIYLENRLEQLNGRGPTGRILPSSDATKILKFVVTDDLFDDTSATMQQLIDQVMIAIPSRAENPAVTQRTFAFDRVLSSWSINGQLFNPDPNAIEVMPVAGTAEEWTLTSAGGWGHPVHIHHEEGQVINRNGLAPAADDNSRKDVYRIGEGAVGIRTTSSLTFYMQFRDWYGDYPMHCHNVVHEDHAMMMLFRIVPPSTGSSG